jgi:hypothetical protein
VELAGVSSGAKSVARKGTESLRHELRRGEGKVTFAFSNPVDLAEGDQLVLEI